METQDNSATQADFARRAVLDRSVKAPVLFFFANAAMWLLASTLLGFISAVKSYHPAFLDCRYLDFLNYGFTQPAHLNALIYGWALQAAFGVALWISARRTQVPLQGAGSLIVTGIFWNIAVTVGIIGIFLGQGTSLQFMEFPPVVWPILLFGFIFVAAKIFAQHMLSTKNLNDVVTWYLLAAILLFPALYITANLLLNHYSVANPLGAFGAAINAWFANGLIWLVLAPFALSASYYFIPKITGKPLFSCQLGKIGFWGLIVLGAWSGMQKYMGGPIPSWMTGLGGACAILLLVPAGAVALNNHLTSMGRHGMIESSPTLRFVFVGTVCYLIATFVSALNGNFWTGANLQFTIAEYSFHLLAIYCFVSFVIFGAIYYIVPRLTGTEWLSVKLIRQHFWFSVYGMSALVICMFVGGVSQGQSFNNPVNWDLPVVGSILNARGYNIGRALAWLLILWSNAWFFIHLLIMILGLGRRSTAPTLLVHDNAHDYVPTTLIGMTHESISHKATNP